MEWKKKSESYMKLSLVFLVEIIFLFVIISSFGGWVAGLSGGNVTVLTELKVGAVAPEVLNVSINNYASSINLIPNSTKLVNCQALVRDWNNDTTITNVTAQFFEQGVGTYGGPNDNNFHYTNNSCFINRTFGTWNSIPDTPYTALANCTFHVWYYANPGTWNCTAKVTDNTNLTGYGSGNTTVAQLLAVGLPSSINYGTVNGTFVSNQNLTNVTNEGNTKLNLSLYGYGGTPGDNYAMSCTLGSTPHIPVSDEKYNLTVSHPGTISLTQFAVNYTNLTSTYTVKKFNLASRQNDLKAGTDDTNATYWRIYVPKGVAGNCSGYIVFGASTSPGS